VWIYSTRIRGFEIGWVLEYVWMEGTLGWYNGRRETRRTGKGQGAEGMGERAMGAECVGWVGCAKPRLACLLNFTPWT
jgi:hypothetical protein